MRQYIVEYLPWLLSVVTLYMTFLQGEKKAAGWLVGLANQVLWLAWIAASTSWGLLPLNIGLSVLFIRNWMKWRQS